MLPLGPSISAGLSPSSAALCSMKGVIEISGIETSGKGLRKIIFWSAATWRRFSIVIERLRATTGAKALTLSGDRASTKGLLLAIRSARSVAIKHMSETKAHPLNVICLATYFKGGDFIRECKRLDCHVVLITKEKMLIEDWPRDSLDDLIAVPNDAGPPLFIDLVAFLARKGKAERVVALEKVDVMTAALIREHFCLPGMSSSTAKTFRDKYRMAEAAKATGVVVPE